MLPDVKEYKEYINTTFLDSVEVECMFMLQYNEKE